MDEKDRLLLTYLRNGFPLTPRPLDVWAAKLGTDSAELLVRIQRLKKEGALGGIKATLDPGAFRYQSAWVAVRIEQERRSSAEAVPKDWPSAGSGSEGPGACEEVFGRHPGVIYGCERECEFNLWFFIAVPPEHDLELHVRCLEKLAGVSKALFLPLGGVFKGIDLLSSLDPGTFSAAKECFEKRTAVGFSDLSPEDLGMLRKLQEPFPLTDEPYRKIAEDLGITEAGALERIKALVKKGCLKRIGGFIKSPAGLPAAKTLVVWQIPEEKMDRIGPEIAGFGEVLYADRRPAFPEFPYALYTMIQSGAAAELEILLRRVQDRIGKWPFRILPTVREFKKERMKYFPGELDVWWRENRHVIETEFITD